MTREKILIIDDHEETRRLITLILEEHGYQVLSAASGMEGVPLAQAEQPDLILLDIMMPEMDGYEVCRRFRTMPHLVSTPIIMFTSKGQGQEKWEGFKAGADDYLVKPTRPDEMIDRIEMILASRQGTRRSGDLADIMGPPPDLAVTSPHDQTGPVELPVPEPPRDCLVAVIGSRGGAGTTTTAVNLAATLAQGDRPTILVDLDLDQGHIAGYLNQKATVDEAVLARTPARALTAALAECLVNYQPNLQLLLIRPDWIRKRPFLERDQVLQLLQALLSPDRYVVVDLGHRLTATSLAVLGRADEVIVCLRPERLAVTAGRRLLSHLSPESRPRVVMLDFSGGPALPTEQLERYLGHDLSAVMPISYQQMAQAANSGRPLVTLQPDTVASGQFEHLARSLAPARERS